MITIEKQTNSIKFTFSGNSWYLQDGTIEVPMNSLMLVTDSSNMATFKKSSTNDIFISATYDELGMTKTQLEDWFKANACSANGGSAVKEMYLGTNYDTVDAETGVVTKYQVGDTVSGHTIVEEDFHYLIYVYVNDDEEYSLVKVDMDNYITENEFASGTTVVNHVVRGVVDPTSESYLTVGADGFKVSGIDAALNEKADVSAFTAHTADTTIHLTSGDVENQIDAAISGKADTTAVTQEISAAVSGKQDTLSAGTNITISGNVISADANNVVNVTQAEYDALVTGGTVDPTVLYNITDATPIDMSQYWTSAQTEAAITEATNGKVDTSTFETYSGSVETALSGKQDTLSAGTNITISGNVISAEGGGKTIEAGRGISITTGETADTVSFNLPISASTVGSSVIGGKSNTVEQSSSIAYGSSNTIKNSSYGSSVAFGNSNIVGGNYCFVCGQNNSSNNTSLGVHIEGENNTAYSSARCAHIEGGYNVVGGSTSYAHSEGFRTSATTNYSHTEGQYTITRNTNEHASGRYNVSNTGSTTSTQTLFSVGNGTADNARHNAFEIRQNGDIYISKDGVDIKLQDNLGSTIEISSAITSGDTNPVQGGVLYDKFDEVEEVTAAALNQLNDKVAEDEEVTAAALNTLSDNFDGLKLKKVTQAQYDALISGGTVDNNTLYVVI